MKINRSLKRTIIILVYLSLFFLLGWFIYSLVKPDPTCNDKKQNQREEKVDCGGPCKPCEKEFQAQEIIVKEKSFVIGGQGRYDVMARISNPNNQLGSSYFSYEFVLKNSQGEVLNKKSGKSFILPVESKYIIETNLETDEIPDKVEFSISTVKWQEFFGYERPEFNINSKRYELISSGVGFSEAKGLLRNDSAFDFSLIKVNVVLRDESGKAVAFNKTEMRTVNAGEERDFRLLWPVNFPGSVQGVEMEAEADVFQTETFTKKYTRNIEQFQKN